MHLPNKTLRIIDANLNRIGESLRLLEDVALKATLSKQLKGLCAAYNAGRVARGRDETDNR